MWTKQSKPRFSMLDNEQKSFGARTGVTRSRNSKNDDNTTAKRKRINNNLQNIAQKTKDGATRTPLKTGSELRCSGRVGSSWSTCMQQCFFLVLNVGKVWNIVIVNIIFCLTLSMYYIEIQNFNPSDTKPCIIYVCDIRCTFVGSTFKTSSAWNAGKPHWNLP